jgi:hypothetical protein
MFEDNQITVGDMQSLVTLWTTHGLAGTSGLACRECVQANKASQTGKDTENEDSGEEIQVVPKNEQSAFSKRLQHISRLRSKDKKSPPHLYFYVEASCCHGREN